MKTYWRRFSFFDKTIAFYFISNLLLYTLSREFSNFPIPKRIVEYSFWLSLGLLIGFKLCKHEFNRALKKYPR